LNVFKQPILKIFSVNVLCRFFDGLRQHLGLSKNNNFSSNNNNHSFGIKPFGVHNYWQNNEEYSFQLLADNLERESKRNFDSKFFNKLLNIFEGNNKYFNIKLGEI